MVRLGEGSFTSANSRACQRFMGVFQGEGTCLFLGEPESLPNFFFFFFWVGGGGGGGGGGSLVVDPQFCPLILALISRVSPPPSCLYVTALALFRLNRFCELCVRTFVVHDGASVFILECG